MDKEAIFKLCKDLGCCDGCGLRYLGIRSPNIYENIKKYCLKFKKTEEADVTQSVPPAVSTEPTTVPSDDTIGNTNVSPKTTDTDTVNVDTTSHNESNGNGIGCESNSKANGSESPPPKRRRTEVCISCLGVLQEDGWPDCNAMVKEVLEKKRYDCTNFACALSSPIATILREKAIVLRLIQAFPGYDPNTITPLKEAWKWSYGTQLATAVKMALDSGAVSPLLITLNMEYPNDIQELEVLKALSPALFESRNRQKRRFAVEFTRRSVEQALEGATLDAMQSLDGWSSGVPPAGARASCISVVCCRAPLYLGGRYIKLSRTLPQTPWLVAGKRMMESSVQETIFDPLAKIYEMSEADAEHRLKFMSAGREDVDVRCLGDGRPFAIEITDPRRELSAGELSSVCEAVSAGGQVLVKKMGYVSRDELTQLKSGEETKCKTYEALCIKLTGSEGDETNPAPLTVTDEDISRINSYRNTPPADNARVQLTQKTPIRVLHRRPLLARQRQIIDMHAEKVPGHPQLFALRLVTSAGAYVKEFVHGEFGRTTPSLALAGAGRADLLALDVSKVHLDWPNI